MTTKVTADYVLSAGQSLSATDETGLWITGDGWTNAAINGRIDVSAAANGYPVFGIRAGVDALEGPLRTLTIGPSGVISVTSTIKGFAGAVSAGGGVNARLKLVNEGRLEVRTPGEAWGVAFSGGDFENRGVLIVDANGTATGADVSGSSSFLNAGSITVQAGSAQFQAATGVRAYNSKAPAEMVNTGTISVSVAAAPATSAGMVFAGYTTIINSGLIEAGRALVFVRDGIISGRGRHAEIHNSGTLRGEVFLHNATSEPVILRNTGRIEGDVILNLGADTYSGVDGLVTGVVRGEAGADSLAGGRGAETLRGDAGDDTINGGGGADMLSGGDGSDLLSFRGASGGVTLDVAAQTVSSAVRFSAFESYLGSEHGDLMRGSAFAETLGGGGGDDTLSGGAGDDRIDGGEGRSHLRGDEGSDFIVGGNAFDDINGNMGDDTAVGAAGEDWVVGGKDNDSLSGGSDYDLVYGNLGNDTCEGGDGNDIVRGGQNDDVLRGGSGDDYVSGDKGNDTVSGGAGADLFHTFGEAGLDRVTDFSAAEGDRVLLAPGTQYTVAQAGADTVISMTGGGQMVLVGVQASALTAGWIIDG